MNDDAARSSPVPRLRMEGVHKRFGATIALAGVDLDVRAGEVLALVGENGAGKSTLMKVLSGAHRADRGRMFLDGEPFLPRNPLESRRAGVAMIYQELSLAKHLSVMENILLGIEPTLGPIIDWRSIRRRARESLGILGRPDIGVDVSVAKLSLAQQQLVEIARAVAVGCRVLVLDEPTSSLTRGDIGRLFELVRRLRSQGHAIVYISHFLEEVKEISDRFTVLRDGKSVGGGVTKDASTSQIITMMVGRKVEDLYPRSDRTPGEVVLEVSGLSALREKLRGFEVVAAGRRTAAGSESASGVDRGPAPDSPEVKLRSASLKLHRGEVLGIAGLVGAGRTELLRAIFGLDKVRSGEVSVYAEAAEALPSPRTSVLGSRSPTKSWGARVGMVSEDRKAEGLALSLSVADNLTLSKLPTLTNPTKLVRDSAGWLKKLGIKCRSPRQPVGDLSGGNQQKVALARLLYHDVDVLLLDEPTRGIDVGSKAQIYQVIDELASSGKAVLMVSSYLPELMGVCDRIAVMCRGVLGEARRVSETSEHQIMLEATGAG